MNRLLIRNATHFVNFADTPSGMMMARAFRRTQPAFKRRHIKSILQLYPSQVPLGEVIEINSPRAFRLMAWQGDTQAHEKRDSGQPEAGDGTI